MNPPSAGYQQQVHSNPQGYLNEILLLQRVGITARRTLFIAEHQAHVEGTDSEEDARNPYSDQQIADKLCSRGIKISRRTVAKYRMELGIESTAKRKRY